MQQRSSQDPSYTVWLGHMSSWKRLKASVDASANEFLRNKRFSREKKTFPWDWHARNLALVCSPSLFLWYYLDKAEKRMLEEARLREEIQERTGVSSRGYLIPSKKLREEVQDQLRSGGSVSRVKPDKGSQAQGILLGSDAPHDTGDISGLNGNMHQYLLARMEMLDKKVQELEQRNGRQSERTSAGAYKSQNDEDEEEPRSWSLWVTRQVDSAGEALMKNGVEAGRWVAAKGLETAEWAAQEALAAGTWAFDQGAKGAKELFHVGTEWLGSRRGERERVGEGDHKDYGGSGEGGNGALRDEQGEGIRCEDQAPRG